MKIVKLETFTKPYVSFVKITVEDGSIGYGQMSTYHADITAQIFHKQVAPWCYLFMKNLSCDICMIS